MTKIFALGLSAATLTLTGCAGGLGGPPPSAADVRPQAISQQDRTEGAKANQEFLAEYGGAYAGNQASYVRQVGQKIAFQSGIASSPSDFTISLLNSPVNNAFAIPGGYVYVTRQLMGLMNNEAELAFVLGHEVGHVAAGHSRQRESQANKTGLLGALGQVIAGVVLGDSALGQLGQQIIGTGAQAAILGYSRNQEYQADDLGILYLQKAGYDPLASSTVLASLAAQTDLDARVTGNARTLPEWASTHPDPAARVQRARELAQSRGGAGGTLNRDAFLGAVDALLYDDDPAQGVVRGGRFLHPQLRFRFDAPRGYTLANGADAVSVSGQNGQAQLKAGGKVSASQLDEYIGRVFAGVGGSLRPGAIRRTTINGVPAAYSSATAQTQQGNVDVGVVAYSLNGQAYHFLTLTQAGQGFGPFSSMVESFAPLSASEAAQIKARVIDVVTVRAGDTASSLAGRMAYDDFQLERFLVLNGMGGRDALQAGQKVKIVRYR